MHNLAFNYEMTGAFREAERWYFDTIDVRRRVLGEMHPSTAISWLGLARVYEKQRRYDESEPLIIAAHEAYRQTLGADNARTQEAVNVLAKLYDAWWRPGKAAQWRARLLANTGPQP